MGKELGVKLDQIPKEEGKLRNVPKRKRSARIYQIGQAKIAQT